jgi:hypothetical protein
VHLNKMENNLLEMPENIRACTAAPLINVVSAENVITLILYILTGGGKALLLDIPSNTRYSNDEVVCCTERFKKKMS